VAWGPRGLYYSTPTAIKLVPIARAESQGPQTSPSVAAPRLGAEDESEPAASRWPAVLVLIVVAAVLAFSLWRVTRRGRA
jgi:hypothetical protein